MGKRTVMSKFTRKVHKTGGRGGRKDRPQLAPSEEENGRVLSVNIGRRQPRFLRLFAGRTWTLSVSFTAT